MSKNTNPARVRWWVDDVCHDAVESLSNTEPKVKCGLRCRCRLVTFYIDLMSVRGDRAGTLLRYSSHPDLVTANPPTPGQSVLVVDEDDELRLATVLELLDPDWMRVEIDWDGDIDAATYSPKTA